MISMRHFLTSTGKRLDHSLVVFIVEIKILNNIQMIMTFLL